jgi:Fe-S cluster biogenesis protein NfuA
MSELNSVVISKKTGSDTIWQAQHIPSGRIVEGNSPQDAEEAMRLALGMNKDGEFNEPVTSDQFSGVAKDIALFLEGPISEMLELHSGFARLESFEAAIATVRLGGGCQGCPSSRLTLLSGVKTQLQDKFGEDVILDVCPA